MRGSSGRLGPWLLTAIPFNPRLDPRIKQGYYNETGEACQARGACGRREGRLHSPGEQSRSSLRREKAVKAWPCPRKTKIVCTIGPASQSPAALARLIRAGMDGAPP